MPRAKAPQAPLSWVETAEGEAVRVPDRGRRHRAAPGSTVEVTVGGQVDDAAAAEGYDPAVERCSRPTSARLPADDEVAVAGPTNEVTVVMVAPRRSTPRRHAALPDRRRPRRRTGRRLLGRADRRRDRLIDVTASHDWLNHLRGLQSSPRSCGTRSPARSGSSTDPVKHLMVYLPRGLETCDYALGEVGTAPAKRRAGVRTRRAGLGHRPRARSQLRSRALVGGCTASTAPTGGPAATAAPTTYRDFYDVMGASWEELGTLNAAQASALGTLPDGAVRTLSLPAHRQGDRGPGAAVRAAPAPARSGWPTAVAASSGWSCGLPGAATPG